MLAKRIIPCLDVTGGRVVKGVNFVNLRDAGDPVELAERYNDQGADELVFLDITASSDAREIRATVVARTARKVFIPLAVGGGIRSVEDARRILLSGAEKVSVNTAAVRRPELLTELANAFGSQAIVLAMRDGSQRIPIQRFPRDLLYDPQNSSSQFALTLATPLVPEPRLINLRKLRELENRLRLGRR